MAHRPWAKLAFGWAAVFNVLLGLFFFKDKWEAIVVVVFFICFATFFILDKLDFIISRPQPSCDYRRYTEHERKQEDYRERCRETEAQTGSMRTFLEARYPNLHGTPVNALMEITSVRQNAFERWIIVRETFKDNRVSQRFAWSGSRWISVGGDGLPNRDSEAQVSNLDTREEAIKYAESFGFTVSESPEPTNGR